MVLSIHDFLDFSWSEILVPGASDWRPLAVGMGIAAFYGMVVVAGSFYVKRWIGQRRWRAIHFASLGVFISSLVHGIWAGTDSSSPLMMGLYLGSAVVVFCLVALRLTEDTAREQSAVEEPAGELGDPGAELRAHLAQLVGAGGEIPGAAALGLELRSLGAAYARDGYPVHARVRFDWLRAADQLRQNEAARAVFLPQDGDRWVLTIGGYLVIGPYFLLGWTTKAIELALQAGEA